MRCIGALLIAAALSGQDPQFDAQSRLVIVPAAVTDAKGRPVDSPDSPKFNLLDNGKPREVTVDLPATGVAPIALVIAVQSSGISAAALDKVRKIGSMIQPLITGDRGCAALLSFDDRVRWLQECTKDAEQISQSFWKLRPGEPKSARMLDAVDDAIHTLLQRSTARRVLLLISESRDRGSENELDAVAMRAQAAGVAVYALTYSAMKTAFTTKPPDPSVQTREHPGPTRTARTEPLSAQGRIPIPPPEQRMDILGGVSELVRLGKTKTTDVLARATGGRTFSFVRQAGLEAAIEKFGAELHSQYVLTFAPTDAAPGYHRIDVNIVGRPDLQVRARPGYWAPAGGQNP